jgi:general secretion pathway protein L
MKLRIFVPASDRPGDGAKWPWMLFDARQSLLRAQTTAPEDMPRADDVEIVLPAARVLFARLALPRVGAATLRDLLPFAVEDRLLGDPSHIHAVAGRTDARGETLVAVIDREWLRGMLDIVRSVGLRPARAYCESALATGPGGDWNLVLGEARGLLVDDAGAGVAFDRSSGAALPLALRIALDEASARAGRPAVIRVHTEGDTAAPDLAHWISEAGVAMEPGTRWEALAGAAPAAGAIDLLTQDFAARSQHLERLRVPRAAFLVAAAIVLVQLAFDGAETWRLARERDQLRAQVESTFRSAFPEAKVVVDARLQMERNLESLRRSRGLAAGDDFLARLTRAAHDGAVPVRSIDYAHGELKVGRANAGAPVAEARR